MRRLVKSISARQDAGGSVLEDRKVSLKDGVGLETTLPLLLDWMNRRFADRLIAVGHRVVHGGMHFTNPTRITPDVIEGLEALVPLDPLHQPHHLAAMRVLAHAMPDVPQVACFDTAFHAGQPRLAKLFALPSRYAASGIIRYGFHGISYEYIASRLREIDPVAASGRTVVAHLGNGSSMCAVKNGRSVASTMGLTPLDGLPMGTRCGTLDPGVILYLMRAEHRDAASIEHLLYQESGLLGVSGTSSDVAALLASDDPRCKEALDLLAYRAGRELGSLAAAMSGIDALVFTGGIGENAAAVREGICRAGQWLGLRLDTAANNSGQTRISTPDSQVSAWVIPTNEELMIARQVFATLAGAPARQ